MFDIQFKLSTAPFIDFSVFDSPPTNDGFQDAFTSAQVSQKAVIPRFEKVEEGAYRDLSVTTTQTKNTSGREDVNSKKASSKTDDAASNKDVNPVKSKPNLTPILDSQFVFIQISANLGDIRQNEDAFVRQLLIKAVMKVTQVEDLKQYHFSFKGDVYPLEIGIEKTDSGLVISLFAEGDLKKELLDNASKLLSFLKERLKDNDIELAVFDIQDASSYNDQDQNSSDDSPSNQDTNSSFIFEETLPEDVSL